MGSEGAVEKWSNKTDEFHSDNHDQLENMDFNRQSVEKL